MYNFTKEDLYLVKLNKIKSIIKLSYYLRLITGLSFITFLICYLTSSFNSLYLYICLGFLLLFFIILILFNKYNIDLKYYNNIFLEINKIKARSENKINNNLGFFDKGKEFKSKYSKLSFRDKYLIEDIDIFGDNSLYQIISQAKSVKGRELLADNLINGHIYYEDNLQNALATNAYKLGEKDELVLINSALDFNKIEENLSYNDYLEILNTRYSNPKKELSTFIILSVISIVIFIISIITKKFILLSLVPIINILISFIFVDEFRTKNITKIYSSLEGFSNTLKYLSLIDYSDIDKNINQEKLLKHKKDIEISKKLYQNLSYKNNIMYIILINAILPFDFLFRFIFNKIMPSINKLDECFTIVSKIELLASVASIKASFNSTIPEVSDKLEFKDLSNILIKNCVPNDLSYTKGIILTGSNMSGKTTFMRTLGINILLSSANFLVTASSFKSPKYMLYTSLRIKDEMSKGVSTFYAEINKIKEIVSESEFKKFAIIDEIFKGTNTLDRIYGAKKLVEKLQSIHCDFIISTHDFELCNIDSIVNYHFDEQYNEDYSKISFEYKIKEGPSHSTNAIFLLKSSNIIS